MNHLLYDKQSYYTDVCFDSNFSFFLQCLIFTLPPNYTPKFKKVHIRRRQRKTPTYVKVIFFFFIKTSFKKEILKLGPILPHSSDHVLRRALAVRKVIHPTRSDISWIYSVNVYVTTCQRFTFKNKAFSTSQFSREKSQSFISPSTPPFNISLLSHILNTLSKV